jgi:outer membrane protein OmpA-like peptidoglycan-associated protein
MSRFGKCQNQAGCLLAYRGEETEIEDGQPFICAECGKPLSEVQPPSAMWMKYLIGLAVVGVVGIVALFAIPQTRALIKPHKSNQPTPAPENANGQPEPVVAPSDDTASTTPVAEPPPVMTAPAKIDLDITKKENKAVKAEVLTRVDLMPTVSNTNKDKLYSAVERARSMGKVLTIPFASGKTELGTNDVQALKSELDKPDLAKLRDDPTAVFVILGYADPKGDAKKNIAISQSRADAVLKAMREKCGVQNVMHTVGMGGSKLLDAQNLEKNRIVEIWAVLP